MYCYVINGYTSQFFFIRARKIVPNVMIITLNLHEKTEIEIDNEKRRLRKR